MGGCTGRERERERERGRERVGRTKGRKTLRLTWRHINAVGKRENGENELILFCLQTVPRNT